jgi:hypothetical protein
MNILDQLLFAKKYFIKSSYKNIVEKAQRLYNNDHLKDCKKQLNKLPTESQLLEELVNKLKGKSVYTTLKKIQKNENVDDLTKLKGLSSFLTHIIIECQEKPEYKVLFPYVINKINELIYSI